MDKRVGGLKSPVGFRKANPLAASEPPIPEVHNLTVVLEAGSIHAEGAYPLPCDILVEYDLAVPLRDGTVLRADVFRPTDGGPAPLIVAYTPYCKRGGWWNENFNATKFGVPARGLAHTIHPAQRRGPLRARRSRVPVAPVPARADPRLARAGPGRPRRTESWHR